MKKKLILGILCFFAGCISTFVFLIVVGTYHAKHRQMIENSTVVEIAYSNFTTGLYKRADERFANKDYKGALEDIKLENLVRKNMHPDVEPFQKDIEAIDCLTKMIDLDEKINKNPKDYNLYYQRALVKNKPRISLFIDRQSYCSDSKGAAEDFSKVLELKPDFKEVYSMRADAIGISMDGVSLNDDEINANFKQMIADYEKTIELNAATKETYLSLAGVYFSDKQYEKALQKFQELTKTDSRAYYGMAITYYAMKDYKNALESLNAFEEKYPNICDAVKVDCPECPCPYTGYYQLRAKINLRLFRFKDFVKDLKQLI